LSKDIGSALEAMDGEYYVMLEDATCYETDMRFPSDVKLLWECNDWIYNQIKQLCKFASIRRPRSKFGEQKQKYLNYQ